MKNRAFVSLDKNKGRAKTSVAVRATVRKPRGGTADNMLFNALYEQSPVPMIVIDILKKRIKYINRACEKITAMEKDKVEGQLIAEATGGWEWFRPDGSPLPAGDSPLYRVAQGESLRGEEYYFKGKERPVRWISVHGDQLVNIGRISAGLVIISDVSNYKLAQKALQLTQYTVDHSADVFLWIGADGKLIYCNETACGVSGYSQAELLGMHVSLIDRSLTVDNFSDFWNKLKRERAGSYQSLHQVKQGGMFPVEVTANYVNFEGKEYICAIVHDITEIKKSEERGRQSLREKEAFLKEIHHRVKNNMQIISSLLDLQLYSIEDEKDRSLFEDSQRRIRAMAIVHEKIYQSDSFSMINFKEYVNSLVTGYHDTLPLRNGQVEMIIDVDETPVDIGIALPCALIVNELVGNSVKHAFPDGSHGVITVLFHISGDSYLLSVADNGRGLPHSIIAKKTNSLGLHLVNILANQLQGKIELCSREGTRFTVSFDYGTTENKI